MFYQKNTIMKEDNVTYQKMIFAMVITLILGFSQSAMAQQPELVTNGERMIQNNVILTDAEVGAILKTNTAAYKEWVSARRAQKAHFAMQICAPTLLAAGTLAAALPWVANAIAVPGISGDYFLWSNYAACYLAVMGIAAGVMIPVTKKIYQKRYYESLKRYEEGVHTSSVSLDMGLTTSGGVGFTLKF